MSDINNDELRRELRSVDRDHEAVVRSWRSALAEIFDPSSGVSTDAKARLLGVPPRREFLRFGGLAITGAALLAACGDDSGGSAATTTRGSSPSTTAGSAATTGATSSAAAMDLTLAKTAASLEALAVATYDTAVKSGLVKTAAIGDAAKLFQAHHQAHLDALNGVVTQSGGAKITEPNTAVKKAIVDPAVAAAKTEADIVALAFTLEDAAAQTYVFAATQLSKPALRSTIMTIGGVEARHRAILAFVAQAKAPAAIFPSGFFKADNPLPADALIK
jgi:hypothetical protein